jgi:GT2 family glycosyltransferase
VISVVIPTTGRGGATGVLDALAAQVDAAAFEVILVADGGPPPDLAAVTPHSACIQIDVITLSGRRGVSAARNAGVAKARGQLVGFLDDDVRPAPTWLSVLARHLAECDAVTGRIIEIGSPATLATLRGLAFDHRHAMMIAQGLGPVDYLNGGNCAVRTDVLDKVGGFDEGFPKSQDRELARRLVHAGHSIQYAPDLVVRHHGRYTLASLWRGRLAAGRANATMLRDGDTTSVGPHTAHDTYGDSIIGLARHHVVKLAGAAALSLLAQRMGRRC